MLIEKGVTGLADAGATGLVSTQDGPPTSTLFQNPRVQKFLNFLPAWSPFLDSSKCMQVGTLVNCQGAQNLERKGKDQIFPHNSTTEPSLLSCYLSTQRPRHELEP